MRVAQCRCNTTVRYNPTHNKMLYPNRAHDIFKPRLIKRGVGDLFDHEICWKERIHQGVAKAVWRKIAFCQEWAQFPKMWRDEGLSVFIRDKGELSGKIISALVTQRLNKGGDPFWKRGNALRRLIRASIGAFWMDKIVLQIDCQQSRP